MRRRKIQLFRLFRWRLQIERGMVIISKDIVCDCGRNIKKRIYFIITFIILIFIFWNHKIDAGGDGRSSSIKVNNRTIYANDQGMDVTEEFKSAEEDAQKAIEKYYGDQEIDILNFCHLGFTGRMTVDVIVNGCNSYTILWKEGKIQSINEITQK